MLNSEIKYIVSRVINDYPESAQDIINMLNTFSYNQLEEYARVAKAVKGY